MQGVLNIHLLRTVQYMYMYIHSLHSNICSYIRQYMCSTCTCNEYSIYTTFYITAYAHVYIYSIHSNIYSYILQYMCSTCTQKMQGVLNIYPLLTFQYIYICISSPHIYWQYTYICIYTPLHSIDCRAVFWEFLFLSKELIVTKVDSIHNPSPWNFSKVSSIIISSSHRLQGCLLRMSIPEQRAHRDTRWYHSRPHNVETLQSQLCSHCISSDEIN